MTRRDMKAYEELVKIDNFIYNTYTSLNYKIIEIPKTSIKNRLEFILKMINKL